MDHVNQISETVNKRNAKDCVKFFKKAFESIDALDAVIIDYGLDV